MKPRVLVYHGVAEPNDGDTSRLLTAPRHVEAHIRFLQKRGFRFLTAEELLDGALRANGSTDLRRWFPQLGDCGAASARTARGPRDVLSLLPGRYRMQHPEVAGEQGRLLDEAEARALAESGMELGSHLADAPGPRKLDDDALEHEVRASKIAVESLTGRPCRTFAYPYGLYDERVTGPSRRGV